MHITVTLYQNKQYHVGFGDEQQHVIIKRNATGKQKIFNKDASKKFASEWAGVVRQGEDAINAFCAKYF